MIRIFCVCALQLSDCIEFAPPRAGAMIFTYWFTMYWHVLCNCGLYNVLEGTNGTDPSIILIFSPSQWNFCKDSPKIFENIIESAQWFVKKQIRVDTYLRDYVWGRSNTLKTVFLYIGKNLLYEKCFNCSENSLSCVKGLHSN